MASKRENELIPSTELASLEGIDISSVYLSCLIDTLRELNRFDVIDELTRSQPSLASFDPEKSPTVPLPQLLAAYLSAQHLVGDAGFSIRMGRKLTISSHGGLSNLLISAPNLKSAIECLAPFYELRAPFLNIKLEERGDRAAVTIDFTFMQNTSLEQIVGGLLTGIALNVLSFYGFTSTEEIAINVRQLNREHVGMYQEFFSVTPEKGRKTFSITFPRHYLRAVSPLANRELFELAISNCRNLQNNRKSTVSSLGERIKEMIVANPENDWSQEALAELFHMSTSTLRRRLARTGLTYKDVVAEAKMQVAKSLLLKSDMQITAISQQLGYSDASNFSSVFKRQTGLSPREFRSKFLGNM